MEELKSLVAFYQSRWNVAATVQLDYYTSSAGQHYAILVTKGVWYNVRLFVEDKHPNCPEVLFFLSVCQVLTWKGVEERIDNFKNFFKKPDFTVSRQIIAHVEMIYFCKSLVVQTQVLTGYFHKPYAICKVPDDYPSNPDKYLKRGDIIATPFVKVAKHTAIYLGNGQVSHVSGHGGGKADGVARIGTLIGDFVSKGTDKIWIVCLPLRIRPREEIAKKAEELAANKFRDGEYNLLLRNCQHFVFLCATGVEYAINI